jgi:pimeloyl-ACP methyl ester carboxylesterase
VIAAAAIVLAIGLLLVAFHYFASVRRYHVEIPYASIERLRAPDGAHIELRRLPGAIDPSRGPPVLCVHGIAIDHRNVDMLEQLSIARTLRMAGRDVWLLTLRSGLEDVPRRERRLVRFEAMARHDVPMAVAEVRARTGASAIDYVGFSMGGMLLYAALGRTLDVAAIRRVVILGSPGKMVPPLRIVRALARLPRWMVPGMPLRIASRLVAFVAEWMRTPIHALVYNPRNVARGVTAAALMTIRDVAQPLMADFAAFMAHEDGLLRFGDEDALAGLAHVRIPVRFFAGAGDLIAPPEAVRAAFDAWGADESDVDKQFVVLAESSHGADYGHGDLAIGQHLARDVFEPSREFLDAP